MNPSETITAAVRALKEYSALYGVLGTRATADRIAALADALARLLPLAELSPEDLREVCEMAEGYMLSRVELVDDRLTQLDITPADKAAVSKLRRAADALEGRQG
jgi:hypothetical protein